MSRARDYRFELWMELYRYYLVIGLEYACTEAWNVVYGSFPNRM